MIVIIRPEHHQNVIESSISHYKRTDKIVYHEYKTIVTAQVYYFMVEESSL